MKRYIRSSKTLEDYENMSVFDEYQMEEIRKGLNSGVDVSVYTDPKYDRWQMGKIRYNLQSLDNVEAKKNILICKIILNQN